MSPTKKSKPKRLVADRAVLSVNLPRAMHVKIQRAARLSGDAVAAFVREAADQKADAVISAKAA